MATLQHFIPAVVLSQFGKPALSGRARKSTIAIRRRGKFSPTVESVEHVGVVRGLYDFSEPGHPDPDVLDRGWRKLEGEIGPTITRLAERTPTLGDTVVLHAHMAGTVLPFESRPDDPDALADYEDRKARGDALRHPLDRNRWDLQIGS